MAQDNPNGAKHDGGGEGQAAKDHEIAAAINTLGKRYETAQGNRYDHDRRAFLWTRRAAIGVGIYTLLTAAITVAAIYSAIQADHQVIEAKRQVDAAEQTLKITRENFETDERPIIWLKSNQTPRLVEGKIIWTYEFSNYGKTPANNIRFAEALVVYDSLIPDFPPKDKWNYAPPQPPNAAGALHTAQSVEAYDTAQLQKFMSVGSGIVVSVQITYEGLQRHPFQTEFCFGIPVGGWAFSGGSIQFHTDAQNCRNKIE
jgi:hypothetical protein